MGNGSSNAKCGAHAFRCGCCAKSAAAANDTHGALTWGAAQHGVARGVQRARDSGVFGANDVHELALIVAVWVNPLADDAVQVEENNAEATYLALKSGNYL
ncbi:MAG: hypothetical protein RL576_1439 [Actinomycetota bacterium]